MGLIMTDTSDFARTFLTYRSDTSRNNRHVEKSSRALLAENLKALIDSLGMTTNGWAVAKRIGERKAARAASNEADTRLDTLDEIAKAAGRKPWELITPPGPVAVAQPSDGGDLDYLLTRIGSRERRIVAYALAAQVIEAVSSGLDVRPIHMREPGRETPVLELQIEQPSQKRKQTRRSTGQA